MSPSNTANSGTMQYPSAGVYADERDGFIAWLRGEFAAANAIIDSLCHHLRSVGEGGEYDEVIGSVQRRRCNWSPVLHMQQYYSVAEVLCAVQEVTWRRQRRSEVKVVRRSGGGGYRCGYGSGLVKDEVVKGDEKDASVAKYSNGLCTKPLVDSNQKIQDPKSALTVSSEYEAKALDYNGNPNLNVCSDVHLKSDLSSTHITHLKPNVSAVAKTVNGSEMQDGKQINAVEGMKMYEDLFDDSEVGKMVSLVNDLRIAGRQRKFQAGQTYVVSKRPMKGHGREMIQLGLPIADAPVEDEAINATSKDLRIEPIPSLFQDVITRLMVMQILTVKPDSCIIDIFNEGDHSQPHIWPHWYGRPICVLFLTECDMSFDRVSGADHPGDHKGSIKLPLTPGSMLVMEGRSADVAKHTIPSTRKQRILVTFTKSQPKTTTPPSNGHHSPLHAAPPPSPSHRVPPPIRSPNHIRHRMAPKHTAPVPTPGVLPNLAARPQLQPIFVPAMVAPAMAFPASPVALPPASGAWTSTLMPHAPPRLPLPGTGVFLPPGGNSPPEKENAEEDCNRSSNGNSGEMAAEAE